MNFWGIQNKMLRNNPCPHFPAHSSVSYKLFLFSLTNLSVARRPRSQPFVLEKSHGYKGACMPLVYAYNEGWRTNVRRLFGIGAAQSTE